jgi:hypothetical protein
LVFCGADISEANTITATDIIEMARNDTLRLVASAIKPIMGGPIKSPINPMDDTAVSAVPGESDFDFPAALYTIGTTEETPIPIKKNPTVEGTI